MRRYPDGLAFLARRIGPAFAKAGTPRLLPVCRNSTSCISFRCRMGRSRFFRVSQSSSSSMEHSEIAPPIMRSHQRDNTAHRATRAQRPLLFSIEKTIMPARCWIKKPFEPCPLSDKHRQQKPPGSPHKIRKHRWRHLRAGNIICMPENGYCETGMIDRPASIGSDLESMRRFTCLPPFSYPTRFGLVACWVTRQGVLT